MGNANRSAGAARVNHNRIAAIMLHTNRYWSRGTSRLAEDSGVSKSTISHLVHGKVNPLYSTVESVVKCLERQLGHPLDIREVVSKDGTYPTPFICRLVGCPGCTPEFVYDRENREKPAFRHFRAGQWTGDTFEFESINEPERSP